MVNAEGSVYGALTPQEEPDIALRRLQARLEREREVWWEWLAEHDAGTVPATMTWQEYREQQGLR